jgi:hypothetical protein
MLGGVQPFFKEGQLDRRALLTLAPAPLQDLVPADVELPRELAELVDALLQKEPANRPSNTRVVRQVLRRVARAIPLAATDSLLEEARPCFRPESAEDIPPAVPADLGREGRSALVATARGGSGAWPVMVSRAWRWPAAIAGLALVACVVYFLQLPAAETRVHIEAPVVRLAAGAELPGEISGRWLVAEVSDAMRERLGPLRVSGPVGATPVTTLYADQARRAPQDPAPEQLRLDLRCVDLLCVFAVTRHWQGRQANQQAVLFPDMSVQQWRDIVHATTRALYP